MATVANFAIDQGTTFRTQVNVGEGFDLQGYEVRARIRKSYQTSQFTDFGTTVQAFENAAVSDFIILELSSEQTKNLRAGRYVYDVELFQGNIVTRIMEGQMEVLPSVSQSTSTGQGIDFAYNSENFVPHMMYNPTTGAESFATTYQDHINLNNSGYVHVYPIGGGISSLSDTPTVSPLGGLTTNTGTPTSTSTTTTTTTTSSTTSAGSSGSSSGGGGGGGY